MDDEQYKEFHAYALKWTPEISRLALGSSITSRGENSTYTILRPQLIAKRNYSGLEMVYKFGFRSYITPGDSA
jgi:hypothetical protein